MQKTFMRLALMALVAVGGATLAHADTCCPGGKCGSCCSGCTHCGSGCSKGSCCKK